MLATEADDESELKPSSPSFTGRGLKVLASVLWTMCALLAAGCGDNGGTEDPARAAFDAGRDSDDAGDASADGGTAYATWCDTIGIPGECTCPVDLNALSRFESLLNRYCCSHETDTPFACLPSYGAAETVYVWVDMSQFGSVCGGRDFPYQNALPACPWDEETP